ncbi:MAG: DUF1492 domain-containing protein [Oscillospiraceae bacterium]|nr:DUF1492 domain-containing protein [Oscillospiraceae bacterium]
MVKDFLKKYDKLMKELKQMDQAVSELKKVRIIDLTDDSPLRPSIVSIIDRYNKKIEDIITERTRLEDLIDMLDDPLERAVMRYKYIECMKWEDVCRKICYEWSQTHRIHRKALTHLEKYV